MRRRGRRGVRMIDGREYLLGGRGDFETAQRGAAAARKRWRLVRIVPAGPHGRLVDDWLIYVHDNKEGR